MTDKELEAAIRRSFASEAAPAALKTTIAAELRQAGAIKPPRLLARGRLALALAAGLLVAVGIWATAATWMKRGADLQQFALLLDTVSTNYSNMEPAVAAKLAAKYDAWLDRLRANDQLVQSLYLGSTDSTAGIDGVSGIVVVRVRAAREVDDIIADSPHVARGGTISVRDILQIER